MFVVQNKTPYEADAVLIPDLKGNMTVTTVIKATYAFSTDGGIHPAETQAPLCYSDEYWGEYGNSSLRYPSDMVCEKKGADIAVIGHVYAPLKKPVERLHASVAVGTRKHTLIVWGDRFYTSTLGVTTKTRPLPFVKMPLRYERAFGGTDPAHKNKKKHGVFMENPVGMGFATGSGALKGSSVPNFEHFVTKGAKKTGPAGFGFIAPTWELRATYAGTYDKAWENDGMNVPPRDADIRFNNTATPYLIKPTPLSGNEKVTLSNLHSLAEKVAFQIPTIHLKTAYIFEHEAIKPRAVLDTLVIEPDENRFILVFRTTYQRSIPWSELIQVTIYDENALS